MKLRFLCCLLMIINTGLIFGGQFNAEFKTRMPAQINRFQPALIPVLTIDGKKLFFDRKAHPLNTGGLNDDDDIWISEKNAAVWSEPYNAGAPLNTAFSDVIFSVSPDGTSALVYGRYGNNDKKGGFYLVEIDDNQFSEPIPMNIANYYNNSKWFYAFLSHDSKKLFLSLERDDSFGARDLYICFYEDSSDSWTAPLNIGAVINSAGEESSPFLAYDNKTLYFSSEGHGSKGMKDLFVSRRLDDSWTNWTVPVCLGEHCNTAYDESSIWLSALADSAYIVSSDTTDKRIGLYVVSIPEKLRPEPYAILHGKVYGLNDVSAELLESGVNIELIADSNIISRSKTNQRGEYYIILPPDSACKLRAAAADFKHTELDVREDILKSPKWILRDIFLQPATKNIIYLDKILFENNIAELPEKSKKLLKVIVKNLRNSDKKKFLIVGHADENGSAGYNLKLSMDRAHNTAYFMQSLGVPQENITVEWQGERQPVSDEIDKNRRVEIYISD